jgi:NDP-sugar pyrophosphorylase family protein
MKVLIPMAVSGSIYFDPSDYPYPLALLEIGGETVIQRVIANLSEMHPHVEFIFVLSQQDCSKYHLDSTVRLLAGESAQIIVLGGQTQGALCTALMAIEKTCDDSPLVISNYNQVIDGVLAEVCSQFSGYDAGCLCIESVHPRWSYVVIEDGLVVEAAEKKPISRHAIAGFYYFSSGKMFNDAAQRVILNQSHVDGVYYIAPVFNQLLLEGRRIKPMLIETSRYHSFFTPQRVEEYERSLRAKSTF